MWNQEETRKERQAVLSTLSTSLAVKQKEATMRGHLTQRPEAREYGRNEKGLKPSLPIPAVQRIHHSTRKLFLNLSPQCTGMPQEIQTLTEAQRSPPRSYPTHSWPNSTKAIHLERTNVTRAIFYLYTHHPFIHIFIGV